MKYDIYFHNDFDGRASAAVMLAFLRGHGDDIEHYVPVKYDVIPQWLDEKFFEKHKFFKGKRNPAIIVDFSYHPATTFWFEHHSTTFKKASWEKHFKPTRFQHYDPASPSACRVVYEALKKDWGWKPPAHVKELVHWLDIIDGAKYSSAKQTIEMKEPALQISNFIEESMEDMKLTIWTIESLSEKSLKEFAREPKVKIVAARIRKGTKAALRFYKEASEMIGRVMVVDLSGTQFHIGDVDRFIPYYLDPKLLYAIRFHPFPNQQGLFHVSVGSNPWLQKQNKKHIGELLRKYGGGGHKAIGGVEVKGKKETLRVVHEIIAFLNKK